MTRFIIILSLFFITALPGIHKILGNFPPEWFMKLFQNSLIGKVPAGLEISFIIIILLELGAGFLFFIALVKKEYLRVPSFRFSNYGLWITQVLFLILLFGSFLIENYDNGFKDFVYLMGVVVIQRLFFVDEKKL